MWNITEWHMKHQIYKDVDVIQRMVVTYGVFWRSIFPTYPNPVHPYWLQSIYDSHYIRAPDTTYATAAFP